jgi:hypothetical protein
VKDKTDSEREFERDKDAFMRRYAVYPTDYVGNPPDAYDKSVKTLALDDKLTVERRVNMIAYARFEEMPFNSLGAKKNAFAVKFHSAEAAKGHEAKCVPVWFLPWWSNAITSMTLPPKIPPRPDGITRNLDPDFFFTAAINGCSVFVHGSAKTPTVSHAGTSEPRSTKAFETFTDITGTKVQQKSDNFFVGGNPRLHWTRVHQRHFGTDTDARSIHTQDYKNYLGTQNTPEAVEYQKFLRDGADRTLCIDEVQSSGCVFGLRDAAGNWSFYLQKNIEVLITKLKKNKHFLGKATYDPLMVLSGRLVNVNKGGKVVQEQEMIAQTVQISIPVCVVKFFPGGTTTGATGATLDKNAVKVLVEQAIA